MKKETLIIGIAAGLGCLLYFTHKKNVTSSYHNVTAREASEMGMYAVDPNNPWANKQIIIGSPEDYAHQAWEAANDQAFLTKQAADKAAAALASQQAALASQQAAAENTKAIESGTKQLYVPIGIAAVGIVALMVL